MRGPHDYPVPTWTLQAEQHDNSTTNSDGKSGLIVLDSMATKPAQNGAEELAFPGLEKDSI